MKQYKVQAPDGSMLTIEGPEGASDEEVITQAQRLWSEQQQQTQQQQDTPMPQTMPQQQQQQAEPTVGDKILRQLGLTARMGYEAFTSPAKAVLEAGKTAYNLMTPEGSAKIPSFYGAESQMLSSMGVPEPETMIERGVQVGGQAMLGTAGLAKAAPKIPTVAAEMSRQIPATGVAGFTSVPVSEITKEMTNSDVAALLAGVGVSVLTASGTAKTIAAVESGKTPLFTIDEVRRRAAQAYQRINDTGVTIKPESTSRMVQNIEQSLKDARMVKNTASGNELTARIDEVKEILKNNTLDFNTLEKVRGVFNDLRISKDADIKRLGSTAVAEIDNFISSLSNKDLIAGSEKQLGKAVKEIVSARKDWRNSSRATILEDVLNTADARSLDPKASESELIRRGFINIAADPAKMKLFSTQEQNIIKSVANGGSLDNLLSLVARFNPARSQLVTGGTILGATQSPVIAGTVAGTGLAADLLQGQLRRRAAEQAVKRIASGQALRQPLSASERGLLTGIFGQPSQQEQ
jgi:hypothetical protein